VDTKVFRNALGQFATGVTIVTARGALGEFVGATVSSFNSVSLDPPMVLWSLDKRANSRAAFESSTHFAVHVLALEQRELAERFAKRGINKFEGLECRPGLGQVPLLAGSAACFECVTRHKYDGGDHVIFVGEVERFEHVAGSPLLFHGGAFAQTRTLVREAPPAAIVDETTGRFGSDFICYLLTRAHFQVYRPLAQEFERAGLSETEYFALSMLCIAEKLLYTALVSMLEHTGHPPKPEDIATLAAKGYVTVEGNTDPVIAISEAGRRAYVLLLVLDGKIAHGALSGFAPQEIAEFADYLKRVIANTNSGSPDVWAHPIMAVKDGSAAGEH
jgi:3-hydroxy-9,10-secoandrosta-1,3,5(10)-triene-9,17-dione monooxygenase reductase component